MYKKQSRNKIADRRKIKTDFKSFEESISEEERVPSEEINPIPESISYEYPQGIEAEHASIAQVFRHIQNPVDYENATKQQIDQQKLALQSHVKFLNDQINEMVKQRAIKIEQSRQSRKIPSSTRHNSRFKYNQWDNAGIQRQVMNNKKLVILLREQLQYLTMKLSKIEEPNYKIKYDEMIKGAKNDLVDMKQLLFEKKRKNVLAGKQMKDMQKRDMHKVYFDLQQDYITLKKKKDDYSKRIAKIADDNVSLIDRQDELNNYQSQLKNDSHQVLDCISNETEEEHYRVMYDTKCRKMELILRKRERDEDIYKRKYYALLKDLEKITEAIRATEDKTNQLQEQLQKAYRSMMQKKEKIQELKQKKIDNPKQKIFRLWRTEGSQKQDETELLKYDGQQINNNDGFLLTQLNHPKSTLRIAHRSKRPDSNQNLIQYEQAPCTEHKSMTEIQQRTKSIYVSQKTGSKQKEENRQAHKYCSQATPKSTAKKGNIQNSLLQQKTFDDDYEDDFDAESPILK